MEPFSLDRPFHFITVVWGRVYSETFLEYCVSSLLSPGNLPALATRQKSKFLIATTPADWAFISSTPIFSKLKEHIEPVYLEIPPCPPGRSGCEHMGTGHKAACQLAHREKAYAVIFTPDCIISDGTVRELQHHAARGIELVWVPALRFAEEPFLAHLRAWELIPAEHRRESCNPLVISGAQMVRAGINSLHTETLSYEWDASYFPHLPSAVWWRVPGENGMLVYCLSWAPFLLDFGAIKSHDTTTLDNWTIDGDYVFKNLGASPKMHVVRDSDEMFYSSWAPLADRAITMDPRFTSPFRSVNFLAKAREFRLAFYGPVFDPLKRKVFMQPARWHAEPLNARWRTVEHRARRILRVALGERSLSTSLFGRALWGFASAVVVVLQWTVLMPWRVRRFAERIKLIVTTVEDNRETIRQRLRDRGDPRTRKRIWWRVRQLATYAMLGRWLPEMVDHGQSSQSAAD